MAPPNGHVKVSEEQVLTFWRLEDHVAQPKITMCDANAVKRIQAHNKLVCPASDIPDAHLAATHEVALQGWSPVLENNAVMSSHLVIEPVQRARQVVQVVQLVINLPQDGTFVQICIMASLIISVENFQVNLSENRAPSGRVDEGTTCKPSSEYGVFDPRLLTRRVVANDIS